MTVYRLLASQQSGREGCQSQSKSIQFVTSCGGHIDGVKTKVRTSSSITSQNHAKLLKQEVDGYLQLKSVSNLLSLRL